MTLIGLSGLRGAGKSTIANAIERIAGYRASKFAEPLYAAVNGLVVNCVERAGPIVLPGRLPHEGAHDAYDIATPALKTRKFAELGDASLVEWLEAFGRGAREHIRPSIWVDLAMANLPNDHCGCVFDDVRYQNEVDAIRERGGFIVRVERPGLMADLFEQERGLPEADYVVVNAGDGLSDIEALAHQIIEEARQRKFGAEINFDRV